MPSVLGVLERRERVALARAEELRAELEGLQAAVAEADEEAVVVGAPVDLPAAGAAGPRVEVPLWRDGVGIEVLPPECARIVALVQEDAAGGGDGARARAMREHLGWSASDAREQAARFRAKRLVERGWLTDGRPGLFRPRTA
ncbi:hypothetical protein ACWC9T_32625 [Kitasatospora sp. NPDC001159]